MGLEAVGQKAVQGRAEALQHQTAEGWVDTAVSRESLEEEEEEEGTDGKWERRDGEGGGIHKRKKGSV